MRALRPLPLIAAIVVSCGLPAPASSSVPTRSASPSVATAVSVRFDGAKAKSHVDFLADPARGGRYSGSAGYRDAATYVADRFREIGLEPLGDNGTYFQHFTMPLVDLTAMSVLDRVDAGTASKRFRPRVDFTESVGGRSGSGTAEAEIAAVGGAARGGGQNDFAGASVSGRIALVTGPPAQGGGSVVENAYAEGAVGVLVIGGATLRYSYAPRFQSTTIPTLVISEQVAEELLAPSGRKLIEAQSAVRARRADSSAPPSGFDVPVTVRMSVSLTPVHEVETMNVVGLLRAPDEAGAKRAILVGGHLDGVGTDPDGSVFPAANDNASGPAVAVEVARALASARASLTHSVVFVAFAGEEEGFYGSEAYTALTATTPGRVESLIAMINLDVIGCCGDTLNVSNEAPELQQRVRDAATTLGIRSESIGSAGSDQISFTRRRVPAVFVGWSDYVLHVYGDTASTVETSRLQRAGDVVTTVTGDLASGR
ncbi:MAG TPA: M28 family peptidase [Candidatus Limnocylindria bacterium]|nr:M28 family peptidase [Candidatus Limnocylindria bacterium]